MPGKVQSKNSWKEDDSWKSGRICTGQVRWEMTGSVGGMDGSECAKTLNTNLNVAFENKNVTKPVSSLVR